MLDVVLAIGIFGVFVQLIAFALNLYERISTDNWFYIIANSFGCLFTIYYSIMTESLPFLVLEVVWGAFAFYKLGQKLSAPKRILKNKRRQKN